MELLRDGPDAGVLALRLNRPRRLNALTLSLTRELLAAVRHADADPAVRVLLPSRLSSVAELRRRASLSFFSFSLSLTSVLPRRPP